MQDHFYSNTTENLKKKAIYLQSFPVLSRRAAVFLGELLIEVGAVFIADLLYDLLGGESGVLQIICCLLELSCLKELLEVAACVAL